MTAGLSRKRGAVFFFRLPMILKTLRRRDIIGASINIRRKTTPVDVRDLTRPKCGGTMEPDRAKGSLNCPYCGHEELLTQSDADTLREKAYARRAF